MKHGAKTECKHEGCTNHAIKGGVCIRHGAKVKRCNSAGCTNQAKNRGVCMKHGVKVKLCSTEGCTNQSQKRGVCKRHGANRNHHDASTAFTSRFGSEFDKTTLTRSNQRTSSAQCSVPEEVVICGVQKSSSRGLKN
jgi:sulfur relay (sulfurtransferase) complex TusBCD TusD component (DsrE family)